jgi:hypothetical protein
MPNLLTHLKTDNLNKLTINSVHYIAGTGTTAGTWLGTDASIDEYYDGLTIAYKVPIAGGSSTTTLNITGSAGTALGAKTVYRNASSKITTHYAVGSVVLLVYMSTGSYPGWHCVDYDTNTDTKVTAVGNHYTPAADANAQLTASISGTAGTYAKDTEYTVLTGVKAQRDAKGHVTGITYTAQKIKDTDTNTHNSHAIISGKKSDGTTDIKGSASSGDITLGDSGVTAGEYGPTANATPGYGSTFNVPDIKVNSKGIVTSITNRTVKIPASDNTNSSHSHNVGVGLVGSGSAGTSGGTYTYKANLRSETALTVDSAAATTTSGRVYPVAVDKSGYLSVNVPWTSGSDTKNTTGSTNSASKLFLVGATEQSANPVTYSNSSLYATNGNLFINGTNPYLAFINSDKTAYFQTYNPNQDSNAANIQLGMGFG